MPHGVEMTSRVYGEKEAKASRKLAILLKMYRKRPLAFMRDVLRVKPTDQQIRLIESATKEDCRVAVKSATATGKTAALCWLTFYYLICYTDVRILITAPTSGQLHRVYRAELVKWWNGMNPMFKDFYEILSTKVFIKGKRETQFVDLVTGTVENKESFAGLHGDKVVLMVDEASALPDEIFDTLYGTLSSGSTAFILVSNPVRNSGKFYDLFQTSPPRWDLMTFTSYDSPNVDKDWIEETIEYYGEESDFVKMRIQGEFPVVSFAQFFPTDLVQKAIDRRITEQEYHHYERVLGVDVARFGDDSSVIIDRQGPKIHNIEIYKGIDTSVLASRVIEVYTKHRYSGIFIDGIGIGAGVVDQLKQFNLPVVDVVVSAKPSDPKSFANLRAQIYEEARRWLSFADIPDDPGLKKDLLAIYFGYNKKLQMTLESKKDMKKREGFSPDRADALTLTFADNIYKIRNTSVMARPIKSSNYYWS